MNLEEFKKLNLPEGPGVYFFKKNADTNAGVSAASTKSETELKSQEQTGPETLYIGKATSLRERVRSYFNDDLIKTRGRLLVDMVAQADTISFQETDSVLEAFILESELIKQYLPRYNTKEKDNKSFNYVVITKEDFPRVLVVRGRNLEQANQAGTTKQEQIDSLGFEYTDVFGPFPFGAELKEAMKLIRRIFPFRDKCEPFNFGANKQNHMNSVEKNDTIDDIQKSTQSEPIGIQISADGATLKNTYMKGKPCFNRSIGLCPGVCTGEISQEEYSLQISHIRKFFKGKKQAVMDDLKQEMLSLAKEQKFEEANEIKKTLSALVHIHDISMIKKDAEFGYVGSRKNTSKTQSFTVRAEAYDIAHMSGKDMVGVMVVMQDGDFVKDQYKKFNIREIKASNDTGALKQVLERRLAHKDWPLPTHIVVDGSTAQINVAKEVLQNFYSESLELSISKVKIKFIAVVKDETHKAREIVRVNEGDDVTNFDDGDVISLNQECHRFAIATHRKRRSLSRGI
ncbi:MAG: hypothetical protein K9M11_01400 [Candidatus Pacebacteria bacterium]|nr:hypothetical protein [Candidatus Paceibacterota bacterium]